MNGLMLLTIFFASQHGYCSSTKKTQVIVVEKGAPAPFTKEELDKFDIEEKEWDSLQITNYPLTVGEIFDCKWYCKEHKLDFKEELSEFRLWKIAKGIPVPIGYDGRCNVSHKSHFKEYRKQRD